MLNEKQLRKLELIEQEKPYYHYAFETVNNPIKFSVFLHLECIERHTTWTPSIDGKLHYNNGTSPSLCVVYKNNEILTCLWSSNFTKLAEKLKNKKNDDHIYEFYYVDMYLKSTKDVEYYLKKFKHIKQMIKRFLIVKNELQC